MLKTNAEFNNLQQSEACSHSYNMLKYVSHCPSVRDRENVLCRRD